MIEQKITLQDIMHTHKHTKNHEDPSVQNQKESLILNSESDGQAGGLCLGPIRNGLWEKTEGK